MYKDINTAELSSVEVNVVESLKHFSSVCHEMGLLVSDEVVVWKQHLKLLMSCGVTCILNCDGA